MNLIKTSVSVQIALVAALFGSFFVGCAHHPDVRPGADGIHRVVIRSTAKEKAERDAISQAENYCSQTNLAVAVMDEKTVYTGTMDESTRDMVHKVSTASIILGGAGAVAGPKDVKKGGSVLGAAGTVGSIMTSGNDYLVEMRFKCQ